MYFSYSFTLCVCVCRWLLFSLLVCTGYMMMTDDCFFSPFLGLFLMYFWLCDYNTRLCRVCNTTIGGFGIWFVGTWFVSFVRLDNFSSSSWIDQLFHFAFVKMRTTIPSGVRVQSTKRTTTCTASLSPVSLLIMTFAKIHISWEMWSTNWTLACWPRWANNCQNSNNARDPMNVHLSNNSHCHQ